MEFDILLIHGLHLLALILVCFSVKVFFNMMSFKRKADKEHSILMKDLEVQTQKLKLNSQKVQVFDNLTALLLKRLFKITKDLLAVQKLIIIP